MPPCCPISVSLFLAADTEPSLSEAGALAAFDNRTTDPLQTGHLGGLLQASTYVSGLSGGSWLVGSFLNEFNSMQDILGRSEDDGSIWQFDMPITKRPREGLTATAQYLTSLVDDVQAKRKAGFDTSLTDVWGRALSYQIVSSAGGGPSSTWLSSIKRSGMFSAGNIPMPIIVADGRNPDELVVTGNATVYGINPWEFGTFDPTAYAFAPLEYLGTNYSGGKRSQDEKCVKNFDSSGYIMGTSSTLFNQGLLQMEGADGILAKLVKPLLEYVDGELSEHILSLHPTAIENSTNKHNRRCSQLPEPILSVQPIQQSLPRPTYPRLGRRQQRSAEPSSATANPTRKRR